VCWCILIPSYSQSRCIEPQSSQTAPRLSHLALRTLFALWLNRFAPRYRGVLVDVPGAEETLDPSKTLYPLSEDQLIEPILMELLAGQYALPTDELITRAPEYTADLKKAVARSWVRLDVLAMHIDAKLRTVNPRPRSQDQPGVLTYQMLREILDKMLGK